MEKCPRMTGTAFAGSFCLLMLSIGSVGDGLEGARYARQGRAPGCWDREGHHTCIRGCEERHGMRGRRGLCGTICDSMKKVLVICSRNDLQCNDQNKINLWDKIPAELEKWEARNFKKVKKLTGKSTAMPMFANDKTWVMSVWKRATHMNAPYR